MRTVVAAANSNRTSNLAGAKLSVAAPKPSRTSEDPPSSFDQVLQEHRTAPKETEPNAPAKTERVKKKANPSATAKPRATKPTDVDSKNVSANPSDTAAPKNSELTATNSDETSLDESESDETAVQAVESDRKESGGEHDSAEQQGVNGNLAVGAPADHPADIPASDDDTAPAKSANIEHIDLRLAAKRTPAKSNDSVTDASEDTDANADVANDAHVAVDPTRQAPKLKSKVASDDPAGDEQQPQVVDPQERPDAFDLPASQSAEGKAPEPAEHQQTSKPSTTAAAADPLGAKPLAPAAKSGGEQHPGNPEQNFANDPAFAPNVADPTSSDSTTEFSFEPEKAADAKHVDAVSSPEASLLGMPKLDAQPVPHTQAVAPAQPAPSPERLFAADNHANIVSNVRTNLLPNGGTMQITLNPPELGAIQVAVQMRDGVMNASFETTSDQATRLLSHSLGELRTSLENSGIAVDKLHVEQAPKNQQSQNHTSDDRQQQQGQSQDSSARREQERRELLQRMWRKLSEGSDPLDMVA